MLTVGVMMWGASECFEYFWCDCSLNYFFAVNYWVSSINSWSKSEVICFKILYLCFHFSCDFLDLSLGIMAADLQLFLHILKPVFLFFLSLLQFCSVTKKNIQYCDNISQLKLWEKMLQKYLFQLTNLCWKAQPTICSIRTFTMVVIFNPLTAWDSNLVWMADLEIHSCEHKHIYTQWQININTFVSNQLPFANNLILWND